MRAMPRFPPPLTGSRAELQRPRAAAGFTLVELMIVVLVGAILLGLAVPAMQGLLASNQLLSLTDGFASSLSLARSEAAKVGANVTLATTGGTNWGSATPAWTMTWTDSSGNVNTIRTGAALPANYAMHSGNSIAGALAFDSTGRIVGGASGVFVICQGGGPWGGGAAKMITVAASGRVRVAQNDSSGQPINDAGTAVTTCTP